MKCSVYLNEHDFVMYMYKHLMYRKSFPGIYDGFLVFYLFIFFFFVYFYFLFFFFLYVCLLYYFFLFYFSQFIVCYTNKEFIRL